MAPIDNALAALQSRDCKPRKSGGGWQARCPAHDDKQASLSITEGQDGKVLLHCHANCKFEEVVSALDLKKRDLFPDGTTRQPNGAHRPPAKPVPLSAADVETMAEALKKDAGAWKHVTEVLRFSPDVVAELCLGLHVDRHGRRWLAYPYRCAGVWTYANCRLLDGEKAFTRVPAGQKTQLYRVDALEDGGTAILIEGERDAAAALTMSLHAEFGGASGAAVVSMPGAEQVEIGAAALATQRLVYLVTDNDVAGEKAAAKLATRLGPERCRRVRFDGFKDLGDLLSELGFEKARTAAIGGFRRAELAGPFGSIGERPNDGSRAHGVATVVRLSDVESEAVSWLWEGRIPRGKLSLIDGDPGLGKSTVALDLAARVSTGSPMPGSANTARATPAGVILISHEDGLADTIRPRLDAAGADVSRVVAIMGISELEGGDRLPALPQDTTEIEACVARTKAALVIIDPFVAYLGAETNSSKDQDVRRALMPLATMAQRTGVAVLLVRHLNKQLGGQALYRGVAR